MRVTALFLFLAAVLISCGQGDVKKVNTGSMEIPKDSSLFTNITWLDSTSRNYGSIAGRPETGSRVPFFEFRK